VANIIGVCGSLRRGSFNLMLGATLLSQAAWLPVVRTLGLRPRFAAFADSQRG